MRYLGGKSRISKTLAAIINPIRGDRPFWDPFCGGLSMSVALGGRGLITDRAECLIALYKSVADGWDPPSVVSEEDHKAAKTLPDSDPRKAFIRFGCSFGGNFGSGFARDSRSHDYAGASRRAVLRDVSALVSRGCIFECIDFLSFEPRPMNCILYLDPPYRNTTPYMFPFDSDHFEQRVVEWSRFTDVWVSEYAFPFGEVVWEKPVKLHLNKNSVNTDRVERLYYVAKGAL